MPGSFRSPAKRAAPVTFSCASSRCGEPPITWNSDAARSTAGAPTTLVIRAPRASSAYVTNRAGSPATDTRPSAACKRAAGTPSRPAASSISVARACAPAARKAGPNTRVVSEPNVPASQGQRSVSPSTMSTAASGTPSSSASICACEVSTPWPISILPENTVTRPSRPTTR